MMERLQEGGEGSEIIEKVFDIGERIIRLVAVYLKAQAVILLVIMLICCIGLWIGKVENAFLGILAGMLDALPFIGTGIVLMPTAFWQLVNGRFGAAILCVVIYVACMGAREFLEPKLMGSKTGMSPVFYASFCLCRCKAVNIRNHQRPVSGHGSICWKYGNVYGIKTAGAAASLAKKVRKSYNLQYAGKKCTA